MTTQNQHADGPDETNVSLRHYLDLLGRRIGLLTAVFAGTILVVFVATLAQRPVYQSSTSFLVNDDSRSGMRADLFGSGRSGWSMRGPNLANHLEMLRSHTLARMVLAGLPEGVRTELERSGPGDTLHASVTRLRRSITARPVRDADVIRLNAQASSPGLARAVASAYVEAYQEFNLNSSRADVSAVKEFVRVQLETVGFRLDSAERRLEAYKRSEGVADITEETRALVERQSAALVRYREIQSQRAGIEQQLAFLQSELDVLDSGFAGRVDSVGTPVTIGLRKELDGLEVERTNLLVQGYADSSPRVRSLVVRIDAVKHRLGTELGGFVTGTGVSGSLEHVQATYLRIAGLSPELARLQASERTLAAAAAASNRELEQLPARERSLARLTRDVDVNRQVYALLAQRHEEARIQEAGRVSAIVVVDAPSESTKVKPSLRSGAAIGLLLALFLSIGTVFAVDRLDTRARRPEDLERAGCPVLASVPRLTLSTDGDRPELVALDPTRADDAESFRVLRTNLQFAATGQPLRSLTVTSAGPSEGKSIVAVNLALVLAQSGRKTLLVDADLRRPRQHRLCRARRKPGLTDVVMLGTPLEQAVRPGPVDGLSLLFAGTTPPSPVDFLNSEAFNRLHDRLRNDFDTIIFDMPPVLVSADAAVLSARVEGVMLVTRMGTTDLRALAEARQILAQAGARVFGVVANDVKPGRSYGYYRYHYRRYHYRSAEV